MKTVIAIIQPERLQEVKQALFNAEIFKMTISKVKGCGQQMGYEASYRGQVREVNLLDKIHITIIVNDECIRIRTGETGSVAVG
jgi:nitrogen regulatory protein P-II 2